MKKKTKACWGGYGNKIKRLQSKNNLFRGSFQPMLDEALGVSLIRAFDMVY